jgi:hypothetical protein
VVVDVPFPLLTVVPLTVVVPPLGPVTVPFSVVPVRVLVTEPVADAVFPRAPLAVPVPVTVLPVREAEPVAVEPLRPVTVFCAKADVQARDRARMLSTDNFFIRISLSSEVAKLMTAELNPTSIGASRSATLRYILVVQVRFDGAGQQHKARRCLHLQDAHETIPYTLLSEIRMPVA